MTEEQEVWQNIPGYEGLYRVSTMGRVWSFRKSRMLKPSPHRRGYVQVTLSGKDGSQETIEIHKIVMRTFDINPGNAEINHINGDKTDARLSNLEYVTHIENVHHARDVLGVFIGERNPKAKFTDDQIREIRTLYAVGNLTQKAIAARYNTTQQRIHDIVTRKNWKHIE
jgi:hypothetical protein